MRTSLKIAALVVFSLAIVGCGGSSAEAAMKKTIAIMNEMCDGIEAGDKDKITGAVKKLEAVAKESKDLKVSKDEENRLREKMKSELETVQKRMQGAMQKAMASGKLKPEDMMELGKAMMNLAKP
jgi:hypothetical protein